MSSRITDSDDGFNWALDDFEKEEALKELENYQIPKED